jgi:hypothetical protein
MFRNPSVRPVLQPADRWQPIHLRNPGPGSDEFGQNAIDCRGTAEQGSAGIDRPELAICLRACQAVLLHQTGRLTGKGQHTLAQASRSDPARAPRSNASSAVKQDDQRCLIRNAHHSHGQASSDDGCDRVWTRTSGPARAHGGSLERRLPCRNPRPFARRSDDRKGGRFVARR